MTDTKPVSHDDTFTLGLKRSSLEGRVLLACPTCGAPGVYSDHESIMRGWSGCYDPARAQQPVGDVCPNCNCRRSPDRDLGEMQASIPLWMWKTILVLKKCYVKFSKP